MAFKFRCPFCNTKLEAEDEWEGSETTCPQCTHEIGIEREPEFEPEPPAPPVNSSKQTQVIPESTSSVEKKSKVALEPVSSPKVKNKIILEPVSSSDKSKTTLEPVPSSHFSETANNSNFFKENREEKNRILHHCPFCMKQIDEFAKKCPYCNEILAAKYKPVSSPIVLYYLLYLPPFLVLPAVFTFVLWVWNLSYYHSCLPRKRLDDPSAVKSFAFLWIPFFQWYWFFASPLRLVDRIKGELQSYNLPCPISKDFVFWTHLLILIPPINILVLWFMIPTMLIKFKAAMNLLAEKNIVKNTY